MKWQYLYKKYYKVIFQAKEKMKEKFYLYLRNLKQLLIIKDERNKLVTHILHILKNIKKWFRKRI